MPDDPVEKDFHRVIFLPGGADFAEWVLAETPLEKRVGKVFPLVNRVTGRPLKAHNPVGPVVSAIGRNRQIPNVIIASLL